MAAPAPSLSLVGLEATVTNGTSVTATATVKASTNVTSQAAGICVRSAKNVNRDFPGNGALVLTTTGTALTGTATFAPGTYTYFACVQVNWTWINVGAAKTFTAFDPPITTPTTATTAAPSGTTMPVGNLPGWTQTFTEDFTTNVNRGSFPGAYANKWLSYTGFPDTSHAGDYDQSIISAQDGNLDLYLHTKNGRPKGAAPVPLVNGKWGGQTYGKFSVRMRADNLPGYGTGFLLWADSDNWNDGEIDFPESGLDDVAKGYNHCPGNAAQNCLVANANTTYYGWHTYTIDWTPTRLTFLIDDQTIATTTTNIPTKPLHWVMQAATTGITPAPTTAGHLLIDWVTIYRYTP